MYHWMLAQYIQYERMELIVNGDNSDADMESNSKTAARAGTSYKIIENWFADVMARYIQGGKINVTTVDDNTMSELKYITTD